MAGRLERVRAELRDGPRPAFEIVPAVVEYDLPVAMMIGWGLSETLCYLTHMELAGEVERREEGDAEVWALA